MLNGLYSAAGALEMAARNHEIVAENLANVSTQGYRRQGLVFDSFSDSLMRVGLTGNSSGAGLNPIGFSQFEAGPMQRTNSPLDAAIVGDAFFALDGPNGPVYTRNGAFQFDVNRQLVSRPAGYRVRGQGGGAITLPANATSVSIGTTGLVTASNGQMLGQLELAAFDRPEFLRRVGTTLFESDAGPAPPGPTVRVEQGFREGSNVQPVREMVSMLLGMRFYEAAEKSMRAISDAIAMNTRPQQD